MGTATKVRDITDMRGEASLYRLDPPLEDGTTLVIASAVDLTSAVHALDSAFGNSYRRSETMVFPASDGGGVSDWGELEMVPWKSHSDALKALGYEVSS